VAPAPGAAHHYGRRRSQDEEEPGRRAVGEDSYDRWLWLTNVAIAEVVREARESHLLMNDCFRDYAVRNAAQLRDLANRHIGA
jgi:hypothetical protein